MKVYHSKLAMSETCEQCKYATLPRQSDITLADFWGIKKFDRKLDDKLGTSIYMINTQKGEMILSISPAISSMYFLYTFWDGAYVQ